jgi:hypothetical protein
MIVCVCGSRGITRKPLVFGAIDAFWEEHQDAKPLPIHKVLHGACPNSPDILAQEWAWANQVEEKAFPADWTLGTRAGPIRNQAMIREAEALIAIWDGKSRGTDDAIRRARAAGIPVVVVSPKT